MLIWKTQIPGIKQEWELENNIKYHNILILKLKHVGKYLRTRAIWKFKTSQNAVLLLNHIDHELYTGIIHYNRWCFYCFRMLNRLNFSSIHWKHIYTSDESVLQVLLVSCSMWWLRDLGDSLTQSHQDLLFTPILFIDLAGQQNCKSKIRSTASTEALIN